MTTTEFYNEFNLAYNNLASNQAPGLDKYEIGVYLTKSQAALVDALYGEFEKSEEARRKLVNLVTTAKLNLADNIADNISADNKLYCSNDNEAYVSVFVAPTDLRYIVNEQIRMNNNANPCVKNKFLKVQPVSLDEVNIIIENPFKFNYRRALRLDTAINNEPYIEIITKQATQSNCIDYYKIRYIKNPDPIILQDLTDGDTIDGQTAESTGSLPEITHRQIVEIAAKMAYADYKQ